jgi:flavin-dependent dehydrogenase
MFRDFHNQKRYLEGSLDFFRSRVNFNMRNIRRYGGYGNLVAPPTGRLDHRRMVGEAGGLQDALWGFGIRIALVSGYLAGAAIANGSTDPYDRLLEKRLAAAYRASVVNRFFYERLGDLGYRGLSYRLASARSPRGWLRKHYGASWWKSWLFPIVRPVVLSRKESVRVEQPCDCLICEPERQGDPLGETAP